MKSLLAGLILLMVSALPLCADPFGHFNGYTTLSQRTGTLTSATDISYVLDQVICTSGCSYQVYGTHKIQWSRTGDTIALRNWAVPSLHYHATLTGYADPGECYYATNNGTALLLSATMALIQIPFLPYELGTGGPWQSPSVCRSNTDPNPCERTPEIPQCTGGDPAPVCPLVVKTGNGPWRLTSIDDGVLFDMNADGQRDRTAWTASGAALAFLARDVDGNGTIDGIGELFGKYAPLPDGTLAANGFVVLAMADDNRDGVIDASDAIWTQLLLWTDANHDGLSQAAELQPIAGSGIAALDTGYVVTHRRDRYGNEYRLASRAYDDAGRPESDYDVFLQVAP